jgi:hypothetical protein
MPQLITSRDLSLDRSVRVDDWFQLDLERNGLEFAQYRIKIGHVCFWIRQYGTHTEVFKCEVGSGPEFSRTTWPEGLTILNGPRALIGPGFKRPKKTKSTKKKAASRQPRRSK